MSSFEEYAQKYQTARMERRNGILQVTLHTEGQSLRWGFLPHGELPTGLLKNPRSELRDRAAAFRDRYENSR